MKELFQSVVNMSITGSYIILAVLVLRLFLRKLPRKYSYTLWLIPGLRLLFPFSISSAFSFFNLMKPAVENQQMSHIAPTISTTTMQTEIGKPTEIILPTTTINPVTPTPMEESIDWWQLAAIVWLIGMAVLLLVNLFSYVRTGWYLRTAIRSGADCWLSDAVELPFVYGIIKPRIILPKGITAEEWPYVLAHERSHIQRKDPLIKLIAFLILAVHWFNPLVWLAFALMSQDMELSCDEMALRRFPQDVRKEYATALLNLSMRQNHLAFATVLSFGKSRIKERITAVINGKKPKVWMSAAAVVLIVLVALTMLTNPLNNRNELNADFFYEILGQEGSYNGVSVSVEVPQGWYVSEEGEYNNQLPLGEFAQTCYLYNENQLIGYMAANNFQPNAYEEMPFSDENYYQTVCPEMRLSSFCVWDPFTSLKKDESSEVGVMDVWFHDMDYYNANPNSSLAEVPSFETKAVFAYDNDIAAYVAIAFAADSGVEPDLVQEIAESLVLSPYTEKPPVKEEAAQPTEESLDDETAQKWLQIAQAEIEKYWQSFMGENVPEEERVTSYQLTYLSLYAYDEDEFAVRATSDYGCLGLYHLSANGNFAPDGEGWYCTGDYREYRFKANSEGQFEIIETGTGGVAQGLTVLETEFEILLGESDSEPSYSGNEQGDLNFSNLNLIDEFGTRNEGSIHYIKEENQLWFAVQTGGQFGALLTAQVDLDNGEVISRDINGESDSLSAITDSRLVEMAQQLYELYRNKGAVLTLTNDDFSYDDFSILEEHFYGKWLSDQGWLLSITYDDTTNLGGDYRCAAFVPEDNSWYIQCLNGGYGYLYRIDASEPDVLYCLGEWGGVEFKSKAMYEQRFTRVGQQGDYTPELKVGTLSSLGQYYISRIYGLTLSPYEAITLNDGSQWAADGSMALEIPYTYLTETPTEDKISCVLQLYPAEIDASEDHYNGIYHALTDIAVTYERINGQWQITSAEKGKAPLEGKLTELEEALTRAWLDLEVSSPYSYSNDKNRSKEFGAATFYETVAVEYQTESNLRAYLGSTFTEACVEEIMNSIVNKTIYLDAEGKVYSAGVYRSPDLEVGGIRRSSIGVELDYAAVITYDVLGSELYGTEGTVLSDNAGEVIGQFQLRAVPTGDGWRFDDWYLPY